MGAAVTPKDDFHAISLSGGKDSTCLTLLMIERGLPIDAVIWADTGMEFPEMYDHIARVDEHLHRERGLHITTLRSPKSFEYMMFDEPKQKLSCLENRARLGIPPYGNGWPGIRVRWCTGQLKTHQISKELNRLKGQHRLQQYVGIAADEAWRCKGLNYPLVDWGTLRPRPCNCAMTGALTSAASTRFITGPPAGAAPSSGSGSCGACGGTTRRCGRGCWTWTTGPEHSSAPVPWDSSNPTGAWHGWRNGLPVRRRRPPPSSPTPPMTQGSESNGSFPH